MKKILAILAIAIISVGAACARDRVTTNPGELPQAARAFIQKHFAKTAVNHIKIDDNLIGGDDYDVVLDNGAEIDFNSDGEWTEIDCGRMGVPTSVVLPAITNYVSKNFRGAKVSSISKKRNKYEVELTNGLDMEFSRAGAFLRMDD